MSYNSFGSEKTEGLRKIHHKEIEMIKSISIIAVIILHTVSESKLEYILSPFHLWHAVPIFMIIAGMNSTMSACNQGEFVFLNQYTVLKLNKILQRILIPYTIVWLFQILAIISTSKASDFKATSFKVFFSFFCGGFGRGSYFTPLFIQHIIFFPIILWIKDKFISYKSHTAILLFFVLSLFLEWLCVIINIPERTYRLLYVRYVFATVLGSYMVSVRCKKSTFMLLASLSCVYIACTSYLKINIPIIYPKWGSQHAPAYFYTALLVYILWLSYPFFRRLEVFFIPIGKATYHIFLVQMVWFWAIADRHPNFLGSNIIVRLSVNILSCLLIGYIFHISQLSVLKTMQSRKTMTC